MKKRLLSLLLGLLLLLAACTPVVTPTAPTNPTDQPTNQPTDQPTDQPTEAPSKGSSVKIDGVGTLCDIAAYEDGFLLLTHKGLFRLDGALKNRSSAGEVYDKLFATEDNGGIYDRLRLSPDGDSPALGALTVTTRGVFFYNFGNATIYCDGEPWLTLDSAVPSDATVEIAEYDGKIYSLFRYTAKDEQKLQLYCDDTLLGNVTAEDCDRFLWDGDTLCLSSNKQPLVRPLEGKRVGDEKPYWGRFDISARSGNWFYYRNAIHGLQRSDGETIEYLFCPALTALPRRILRLLITGDTEGILLAEGGELERITFSVTRSFPRCTLVLTGRTDLISHAIESFNLTGSGVFIQGEYMDSDLAVPAKEQYDLFVFWNWFDVRRFAHSGGLMPLSSVDSAFCSSEIVSAALNRWLDLDGERYCLPVDGDLYYMDCWAEAEKERAALEKLAEDPTLENFMAMQGIRRKLSLEDYLTYYWPSYYDAEQDSFRFDSDELRALLQWLHDTPGQEGPHSAYISARDPFYVATEYLQASIHNVSVLKPSFCLRTEKQNGIGLMPKAFLGVSAACTETDAAAVVINYFLSGEDNTLTPVVQPGKTEQYKRQCNNELEQFKPYFTHSQLAQWKETFDEFGGYMDTDNVTPHDFWLARLVTWAAENYLTGQIDPETKSPYTIDDAILAMEKAARDYLANGKK